MGREHATMSGEIIAMSSFYYHPVPGTTISAMPQYKPAIVSTAAAWSKCQYWTLQSGYVAPQQTSVLKSMFHIWTLTLDPRPYTLALEPLCLASTTP
eukprot:1139311-Rhodomonas_salina.2